MAKDLDFAIGAGACLASETSVYARVQAGERPVPVRELSMLRPNTVRLWNGNTWIRLHGLRKSRRRGDEVKLTLRSGEQIACAPAQRWPTQRGVIPVSRIAVGDRLRCVALPEPECPLSPQHLPDELIGWFVGLYLAEGSRGAKGTIEIASHANESDRFARMANIARQYGARARVHFGGGKKASARIDSRILSAILDAYLVGNNAKTKRLKRACWCRTNCFLDALLRGYLGGDGHWEAQSSRWRLGFARNYYLAGDLRCLCARLGYQLTLKPAISRIGTQEYLAYRGEIRFKRSRHHNAKDRAEVMAIGTSRHRAFYELSLAGDTQAFALASGVLAGVVAPVADRFQMPLATAYQDASEPSWNSQIIARHIERRPSNAECN